MFINLKGTGHNTPDRGRTKQSQLKRQEKEQKGLLVYLNIRNQTFGYFESSFMYERNDTVEVLLAVLS